MGPEPELWFHRVEADLPDLRAAMTWLRENGDVEAALTLAGSLAWFWAAPNYISERRAWYEALIQEAGDDIDHAVLAKALMASGDLADRHGDTVHARTLLERALTEWRAAGDRQGMAATLRSLGSIAIDRFVFEPDRCGSQGNGTRSRVHPVARGSPEDWRQLGDRSHYPSALHGLAWAYMDIGQLAQAWEMLEAALSIATTCSEHDTVWTLTGIAALAARIDQPRTAIHLLAAATRERHRLGTPLRPPTQQQIDALISTLRAAMGDASSWVAHLRRLDAFE